MKIKVGDIARLRDGSIVMFVAQTPYGEVMDVERSRWKVDGARGVGNNREGNDIVEIIYTR